MYSAVQRTLLYSELRFDSFFTKISKDLFFLFKIRVHNKNKPMIFFNWNFLRYK